MMIPARRKSERQNITSEEHFPFRRRSEFVVGDSGVALSA
jgi:hypothetical protein